MLLYVALAAGTLLIAAAGVLLPERLFGRAEPPAAGEFRAPGDGSSLVVLEVVQVGEQGVVLSDPSWALPKDLPVERLEAVDTGAVTEGSAVVVIGVRNEVRNFALKAIVIQPRPADSADLPPRSELGFVGHEPAAPEGWEPVLWGTVSLATDGMLRLATTAGEVTLQLAEEAPLFAAERVTPADLVPGDRVAIRVRGGTPSSAIALPGDLVRPQ